MKKVVEYKRKSRTITALDLGTFIDPDEGLKIYEVPEGEAHLFRKGDIAFIRIDDHWQKLGFGQNQTIEGPFIYAGVAGATVEDVATQYKTLEQDREFSHIFLHCLLILFAIPGLLVSWIAFTEIAFIDPYWPIPVAICLAVSIGCLAISYWGAISFKGMIFEKTKYWLDQGNQEYVIELGAI